MARHYTPSSMLKESLDESLEAARFCCEYKKAEAKWKPFDTGGCLGFPGGILLFSIVDTIGSYFRNNKTLKIKIDGKDTTINAEGWEHFKILNSNYFNQNLTQDFIKVLYSKYRNVLTHNSLLSENAHMMPSNEAISNYKVIGRAFFSNIKAQDGGIEYWISLKEFYDICMVAVTTFKKDIDVIVPFSKQGKKFN